MPRKRIELERSGMQTPRERIWSAIRRLRKCTCLEIQEAIGSPFLHVGTIQEYLSQLEAAGYLKRIEGPRYNERNKLNSVAFQLLKESFDAPRLSATGDVPKQGIATLAMWRAMKALKVFDYRDVRNASHIEGVCDVSLATAKTYVVMLAKAGYFRTLREAKPGTPGRYRLVRDTGAHAPAITRRKCVFDRNMGAFTWEQTVQEVCDGLQ